MKFFSLVSVLFGVAVFFGCNDSGNPAAANGGPVALASIRIAAANSPCAVELSRFQRVLQSDLDTGNVNKSVYAQMERELSGATRACDAGRDGEAIGIIRATKSRHGYRADA